MDIVINIRATILQYNRGNNIFSEDWLVYAGIAATDWSWSPLWIDFDNDGLKDLVYFEWNSKAA